MTIPELLIKAFDEKNWDYICEAYKSLTGNTLLGSLPIKSLVLKIKPKLGRPKKTSSKKTSVKPKSLTDSTLDCNYVTLNHLGKLLVEHLEETERSTPIIPQKTKRQIKGVPEEFVVQQDNNLKKTQPIQIGHRTNIWKDDGKMAVELRKDSKKHARLAKKDGPKEYRPPLKKIKVICHWCDKTEMVHPSMVPLKLSGADGNFEGFYQCNSCNSKRGRDA